MITEVKFYDIEKFFQELCFTARIAVIYGSDDGMILLAYKKIIHALTTFHHFSNTIAEHDYKKLKSYNLVLKDNARSLSLFDAGYCIIVIKNITENIDKEFFNILNDLNTINCFVLIIAPEIKKTSKTFLSLKSIKNVIFIACYAHNRNAIKQLIQELFTKYKVQYEYNVIHLLTNMLPQYYLCAYYAIHKLILYKMEKDGICTKISCNDLEILMQDSDIQADEICLNFLNNDYKKIYSYISDAKLKNFNPILIIKLIQSYLIRIIHAKSEIEKKTIKDNNIIKKLKPPIFWRYKEVFMQTCDKLTYNTISNLFEELIHLEILCKQNYSIQSLLLENFLLLS